MKASVMMTRKTFISTKTTRIVKEVKSSGASTRLAR
tara:strand:- start:205 stop:312 length:108 start_codon:yes stop_codon:yes gene_type:complete